MSGVRVVELLAEDTVLYRMNLPKEIFDAAAGELASAALERVIFISGCGRHMARELRDHVDAVRFLEW